MKQDNPHAKHRQRLRERFLSTGLEGFQDHEILELALFYVYSRRDTNPIGHALIERFGSLSGVLDAPVEALRRVPGVGPQAAVFLKLLPALFARYESSKYDGVTAIGSPQPPADYILPRFIGKTDELVYLLALDAKHKVLFADFIHRGSVNAVEINTRRICEIALSYQSTCVVLAHNHPSGLAVPSEEDMMTTQALEKTLLSMGVTLMDHIVVADGDYVSFAESGFLLKQRMFAQLRQKNQPEDSTDEI